MATISIPTCEEHNKTNQIKLIDSNNIIQLPMNIPQCKSKSIEDALLSHMITIGLPVRY